jgi:hypothetical protein
MGMAVTLNHALAVVVASAAILFAIAVLAARSTKTTHPTYCAHCWTYKQERTIITFCEEKLRWGICPECVHSYWQFDDDVIG